MFWNHATISILQQWQIEIDYSLETGQRPLLQLGESLDFLDVLPAVNALQELVDTQLVVNTPHVLVGGKAAGWLLALWRRRAATDPARSSGVRVVFSGADAATTIASVAITGNTEQDRLHHWREVRPLALATRIEPGSQLAAVKGLDTLPLIAVGSEPLVAQNGAQDWTAWLAVALIVSIVALSFI